MESTRKSLSPPSTVQVEDDRTSLHPKALRRAFLDHLSFSRARQFDRATAYDRFVALALSVRDRLTARWATTQRTYFEEDVKRAYYLSAEFLLGRLLLSNLQALDLEDQYRSVLGDMGIDLDELLEQEPDAGLGNGGLGRLAACFLDSLASLGLPAMGYGIRYEFGIFEQAIRNGYQVERADEWLRFGNPWEIERPEFTVPVQFGGRTDLVPNGKGGFRVLWHGGDHVVGVPYDTPIAGYHRPTVNTLRLWAARAAEEFDFEMFNAGDYVRAVQAKNDSEVISKVLYPNDNFDVGKELRLRQEYFFVACSIHDVVSRYRASHPTFERFSEKVAIQLNDTHPAIAIAELMRVLVDQHQVPWEVAFRETVACFGYTNHTLLPEALERWPVPIFKKLLPRHLEIVSEMDRRFTREVLDAFPSDHAERIARMSIVSQGPDPHVRMAHLAVLGSGSVNGVARLHSELVRTDLLKDFSALYPERFHNRTNGVTPRRWLLACNPRLARLVTSRIGDESWVTDLEKLSKLEPSADDPAFRAELRDVKRKNKEDLSKLVRDLLGLSVDPASIFDVQIKRLHEYKRQLLCALHAVALYLRAKRGEEVAPRTVIFGAKAAPGYRVAKLIIKLIHAIAFVINGDRHQHAVRVAFLPNYRVSLAERIIPAADLSEQISTAGMEASGTGNMKLAMNGALTIGTLDGANIEIREAVGADNFFLFGMNEAEVREARRRGVTGASIVKKNEELAQILELLKSGFFCPEERDIFVPLVDRLLGHDEYMVLADYEAYAASQREVDVAFADRDAWSKKAALNVARMGFFSSDRTIREYAEHTWRVRPVEVGLEHYSLEE